MATTLKKNHRSINVLLVEDNIGDVTLIKEVFKNSKYPVKIVRAKDGMEAMDYLWGRGYFDGIPKPDLILLDLTLPKKGGFDVLHEVKTDIQLATIPVVILSNSNLEEDVRRAYEGNANYYLVKPTGLEELTTALRKVEEIWLANLNSEDD